ncbi:MAG: hypothetical protein ACFFDI_23100 [Promethearchaeota archaeon]
MNENGTTLPRSFWNLTNLQRLELHDNPFLSTPEDVLPLLQACVSTSPSNIRAILPLFQNFEDSSPVILSFLVKEGKNLSEFAFLQLFELVRVDEVSPVQVQALRPVLLSILLASSIPSKLRLQAKQALKQLGKKEIIYPKNPD